MLHKQEKIGLEIRKLNHEMNRNLELQVKAEGIDEVTLMHGWVMRYLYENRDRVICQKDIEHTFDIRRSTVTNIIQLMEKKGYVERRSVPGDARLKCVSLTAKGEENHLQMEHLISMLEKEQVIDITEEELDSLYRIMTKIKKNLIRIQVGGEEEEYASDNFERSERIETCIDRNANFYDPGSIDGNAHSVSDGINH